MSFRPKTAQAQRQDRQESSIPIPRTKSIPTLRRPPTSQGVVPPIPLGISRTQSQVPIPRQVGISRKPSIPLRSAIPHAQVSRKVSNLRLRSPAPASSTAEIPPLPRGREKRPLPARSVLNLNVNPSKMVKRNAQVQAPPSPSINSVPVVNRLSRKASIPIIARATYITPPGGFKFGKSNVKDKEKEKEKREEDIFQGGSSIIEPTKLQDEVERPGIQKMMMRGNKIERPDYLGEGQELQDMSIDLNGMSVHLHSTHAVNGKRLRGRRTDT
jgi:hypothetical protein